VAPADSLIVFVVSLLVCGLDIFVGAKLFTSASSYTYAVVTAGIAVLVLGLMSSLFGGSPVVAALTLVAYPRSSRGCTVSAGSGPAPSRSSRGSRQLSS
jgi:membrane protein implicated in regulation of membrane protease activity